MMVVIDVIYILKYVYTNINQLRDTQITKWQSAIRSKSQLAGLGPVPPHPTLAHGVICSAFVIHGGNLDGYNSWATHVKYPSTHHQPIKKKSKQALVALVAHVRILEFIATRMLRVELRWLDAGNKVNNWTVVLECCGEYWRRNTQLAKLI